MNLSKRFPVRRADDVRKRDVTDHCLDHRADVYVVEQHQLISPVAVGVQLPVGVDGFTQAGEEEGALLRRAAPEPKAGFRRRAPRSFGSSFAG